MEKDDFNFIELSRSDQILTKYLLCVQKIKFLAEYNCKLSHNRFNTYLLLQNLNNVQVNINTSENSYNDVNNGNSFSYNIHSMKNEIYQKILFRKKILFWIFCFIIAYIFVSYKNEMSTIVLRNIQTFIYPGMKLWRKITLPLISSFPSLTEFYDESCLLMNPLFRIDDLNCEPCVNVVNVLELTNVNSNTAQKTEFMPFMFKINQNPIYVSDLYNLYVNEKDVFQRDAYRVKSTNHGVKNLDQLFADFNRSHQIESHNLWRCNRMPPARLLRRLILKPKRLFPATGVALERHLAIDTPNAPTYTIPDAECSNIFVQQILGTRIIILRPAVECKHKCRTISVRLPQSFVLSYNWWYWRPVSLSDQITKSNSISLFGSYC